MNQEIFIPVRGRRPELRNVLELVRESETLSKKSFRYVKITPREFGFTEATPLFNLLEPLFFKTWVSTYFSKITLELCDNFDVVVIALALKKVENSDLVIIGTNYRQDGTKRDLKVCIREKIDLDQELVYRLVELDPSS